jgi:diguanylate cyclase (GGDEF)-like protein
VVRGAARTDPVARRGYPCKDIVSTSAGIIPVGDNSGSTVGGAVAQARTVEQERDWFRAVLEVQADLQTAYVRSGADRSWWDAALRKVIALSGSTFGFLGRVEHDPDGTPYLHSLAITDIAWNDWSRGVFDQFAADGLEFRNLQSLFGVTVAGGGTVVSDDPSTDPRRCGLPPGHPPLDAYLGIPLHDGTTLVGMIGLANRPGGYDEDLVDDLQPVLSIIAATTARDIAERRAAQAQATANRLESALDGLSTAEHVRRIIDDAVRGVMAAGSLDEARDVAVAAIAAISRDAHAGVLAEDARDPDVLTCVGGSGAAIPRDHCRALQGGRMHVSLPGKRLGACAHADPMNALTICCPIATDRAEYGLLVAFQRDTGDMDAGAHAAMLGPHVERLAEALAQVALREDITARALRDPLTGLPNRTALQQYVKRRLTRIDAAARPFGVLIVDLDDFKDINDQLGHQVGDDVLMRVASALQGQVRDGDLVSRIGGDEFVVILGVGDREAMQVTGQRLIDAVADIDPAGGPGLSASVGGVPLGWGPAGWDEAYQAADLLLYEAKAAGKNQVIIGDLLGEPEQP